MTCTIGELLKYNNIDVECPDYISSYEIYGSPDNYSKPKDESKEGEHIFIFQSEGKTIDYDEEIFTDHRLCIRTNGSGSWIESTRFADDDEDDRPFVSGKSWDSNGREMDMIS